MLARPTIRRLSVGGLVAAGIFLAVFALSLRWSFGYKRPGLRVGCGRGVLVINLLSTTRPGPGHGGWWSHRQRSIRTPAGLWPSVSRSPRTFNVVLPLWLPLVIVLIPSVTAWYRTRPPPPGHCLHCSYDLTGNESGVCPECGTKVS